MGSNNSRCFCYCKRNKQKQNQIMMNEEGMTANPLYNMEFLHEEIDSIEANEIGANEIGTNEIGTKCRNKIDTKYFFSFLPHFFLLASLIKSV